MSDQDLKETTQEAADQPTQDETPLFSVDGRDYSKDAAVKKIESADGFINTLKSEGQTKDAQIANLQAQLDQATKLDEAIASIQAGKVTEHSPAAQTAPVDTNSVVAELTKTMQAQINDTFSQNKAQENAVRNETESMNAAKAVFGTQYNAKLREKATLLGMSDVDVANEAKANPAKFKELFGLNKRATPSISPSSSSRTVVPKPSGKLDFAPKFNASGKREASMANMAAAAESLGIKNFNL